VLFQENRKITRFRIGMLFQDNRCAFPGWHERRVCFSRRTEK